MRPHRDFIFNAQIKAIIFILTSAFKLKTNKKI